MPAVASRADGINWDGQPTGRPGGRFATGPELELHRHGRRRVRKPGPRTARTARPV